MQDRGYQTVTGMCDLFLCHQSGTLCTYPQGEWDMWLVLGGQSKELIQSLSLIGSSQHPWGAKTSIKEIIGKWYKWPSFMMTRSWKQGLGWEKCIQVPLELFLHCVTLSLSHPYFIAVELWGGGGTFCLQDHWIPGPILLSFLLPSRMSKVPWKSKWLLYLSEWVRSWLREEGYSQEFGLGVRLGKSWSVWAGYGRMFIVPMKPVREQIIGNNNPFSPLNIRTSWEGEW